MLESGRQAVAVISVHASPLGDLGRGENGGMNLAIRRLCEGLSMRGIPTDVFVRRDSTDAPDEELIAPFSRLVRLPVGPPRPVRKETVRFLCDEFAVATAAHARSERRDYRAVHGHYWYGGLVARRLREEWRVAWIQSFHTLARTKARAGLPLDALRARTEHELVAGADRLVAASVSEAKDLIRLHHAPRDKICVAHPGVDSALFAPQDVAELRRDLHLEGRRVALFAGRLEPLKGAQTLLDAVALLRRDPAFGNLAIVVAGDDSGDGSRPDEEGERRRLERHAASIGLAADVRFVGAVSHDRLAGFYSLADVCVVPSRTESFGLVALEAQALGTPVVASSVGGLREVVEDGATGVLVEGHEPAAFARAIAAVLVDPVVLALMGEEARRRAGRFTWGRAVDRLAAIYRRVSEEARPTDPPCGYEDEDAIASMAAAG